MPSCCFIVNAWERKQRLVSEGAAYQNERSSYAPRAMGFWSRDLKLMHNDLLLSHTDIVAPDDQLSSNVQPVIRASWSVRTNRYLNRTSLE